MALNLLRDCKDIKGEEEKKEGCVKHRERSSEVHFLYQGKIIRSSLFVLNNSHFMFKN